MKPYQLISIHSKNIYQGHYSHKIHPHSFSHPPPPPPPPPPPQQFMIKCGNAYSPWYGSWINNAGCYLLLVRSGTQQYCSGTCIPQSTFCAYKESNWDSNQTSSSPITFQKWIIKYKDKKINRRVWLLWKIKQPHTNTISEPRVWYLALLLKSNSNIKRKQRKKTMIKLYWPDQEF